QKRMDEGKSVLDDVEKKDPKYPGLALEFGYYYLHTNQVAEALKRYQSALDAAPNDADVKLNVGIAMVESGNPDAEQTLPLELDKSKSDAYWLRAEILSRRSQFKDAIAQASEALKQNPNLVAAHATIAYSQHELGNDGEALAEYRKAIEGDPTNRHAAWWR